MLDSTDDQNSTRTPGRSARTLRTAPGTAVRRAEEDRQEGRREEGGEEGTGQEGCREEGCAPRRRQRRRRLGQEGHEEGREGDRRRRIGRGRARARSPRRRGAGCAVPGTRQDQGDQAPGEEGAGREGRRKADKAASDRRRGATSPGRRDPARAATVVAVAAADAGGASPPTGPAATPGTTTPTRTTSPTTQSGDEAQSGDGAGSRRRAPAAPARRRGRRLARRPREDRHAGAQAAQSRGRDHQRQRLHPPRGQEAAPPRGPGGRTPPRADRQRGRVPGPPRVRRPGHGHPPARGPHPDRRPRGRRARGALRRPRVADLADRQRLPRSGAERAPLDGGRVHRHRQGSQRRALRRRGQLVRARPQGRAASQDRVGARPRASPCWCRSPRTRSATRAPA